MKPVLLSKAEAARRLGVSVQTLQKMIRSGEVPARRFRRRVLIPTSFIERMATAD